MNDRRRLTRSELELWRRSTADVRPLADVEQGEPPPPAMSPVTKRTTPDAPKKAPTGPDVKTKSTAPAAPRALDPQGPVDIDRRSWERLKRGQLSVERTVDLHGMTQTEAHDALDRFLTMASATGLRCVLVVTGKGGADGRGVLRRMVPRWLGEVANRDKVLTYSPARPRHGGDGALYVLLRRRRNGQR